MSQSGIFVQIHREILDGSLHLPALPDIALRISEAVRKPNIDLAGVAKIIQIDAGLTAYLVQVANSPLYRGGRGVDSLNTALSRLGLSATRNLATSYTLAALFHSDKPELKPLLQQMWSFSARLAATSGVLARQCKGFDSDRALLAGLLQDLGCLPLLQKAAQHRELLADAAARTELLNKYAANVGCTLLKLWGFDDDLIEVVRSREDWQRNPKAQADYADIVLIARLHVFVGTPRMASLPKLFELPALHKLPVHELSPEFSLQLLDESRQQIAELQRSLKG